MEQKPCRKCKNNRPIDRMIDGQCYSCLYLEQKSKMGEEFKSKFGIDKGVAVQTNKPHNYKENNSDNIQSHQLQHKKYNLSNLRPPPKPQFKPSTKPQLYQTSVHNSYAPSPPTQYQPSKHNPYIRLPQPQQAYKLNQSTLSSYKPEYKEPLKQSYQKQRHNNNYLTSNMNEYKNKPQHNQTPRQNTYRPPNSYYYQTPLENYTKRPKELYDPRHNLQRQDSYKIPMYSKQLNNNRKFIRQDSYKDLHRKDIHKHFNMNIQQQQCCCQRRQRYPKNIQKSQFINQQLKYNEYPQEQYAYPQEQSLINRQNRLTFQTRNHSPQRYYNNQAHKQVFVQRNHTPQRYYQNQNLLYRVSPQRQHSPFHRNQNTMPQHNQQRYRQPTNNQYYSPRVQQAYLPTYTQNMNQRVRYPSPARNYDGIREDRGLQRGGVRMVYWGDDNRRGLHRIKSSQRL